MDILRRKDWRPSACAFVRSRNGMSYAGGTGPLISDAAKPTAAIVNHLNAHAAPMPKAFSRKRRAKPPSSFP